MKIIQVHNFYQQAGGEDGVVDAESQLLQDHGFQIIKYFKHNSVIKGGLVPLFFTSIKTIWNQKTYREIRKLIQNEKPEIVHCHNTFPLISPSIYWACAHENIPVVQTLHNYRLLCVSALLFRKKSIEISNNNNTCELCVKKNFKWSGIKYGCYRGSKLGSLTIALMLWIHKIIGTWSKKVTAYIALTEFQKSKMIEGGIPEDKIYIKPNFISSEFLNKILNSENIENIENKDKYFLFVGRLSIEKGCETLIKGWEIFQSELIKNGKNDRLNLLIVGDGPEKNKLEKFVSKSTFKSTVHFLGKKSKNDVLNLMQNAEFLILPSTWYEGFPMTIIESYACSLPVIASRIGSMIEVINEDKTGLLFEVGNENDLAKKLLFVKDNPLLISKMKMHIKLSFNELYSDNANYKICLGIYRELIEKVNTNIQHLKQ